MLMRLVSRWRWRRSSLFEEAVVLLIEDARRDYGTNALGQARRKAKRRDQPARRKMVWREVARRLEAEVPSEGPAPWTRG